MATSTLNEMSLPDVAGLINDIPDTKERMTSFKRQSAAQDNFFRAEVADLYVHQMALD